MADPTKAEPRNPDSGGETAQESVDRIAGSGGNPAHPAVSAPTRPAPSNLHPIAKGVYGSPVTQPILGKS